LNLQLKTSILLLRNIIFSKIETDGEFDPNVHNAIMQVDSADHESGQIVAELQKGYMLKDRLLRPSMVSIAN
jgi:molecular chaperone GrpE